MGLYDDDSAPKAQIKHREPDVIEDSIFQPPAIVNRATDIAPLVRVAQDLPRRDYARIGAEARTIGELMGSELDDKGEGTAAFYRFPAGKGGVIEGPTIGLMDALAGAWGMLYSEAIIVEERGNTVRLRCQVIDLVTLTGHARDFTATLTPAPGKFEADRWRTMQLSSATSKAMRATYEHALPAWLVGQAMAAAKQAAARARLDGKSLPEAREAAVRWWTERVPLDLLEQYLEAPVARWTAIELGVLRGLFQAWGRGEVTLDTLRADVAARAEDTPPSAAGGSALDELGLGKAKGGGERKPRQSKASAPKAEAPVPPTPDQITAAKVCRDILGAELATAVQVELGFSPALTYDGMTGEQIVKVIAAMDARIGPKGD